MSTRRTIDIDIKNNADQTAKDFENLSRATNVANDSIEGLNKTFEEANGDIQPLTARMGEAEDRLYELALAGDTTSREYQGLLEKVGQYRQVQINTDLAVDQAAKTLSQKLGTALTGAASGFTAVTGAIGLMGTESEELNRLLLKVNAAMALQQGIEGIREYSKSIGLAGKATKLFNLIVSLNPLTIFLTIITAVIAGVVLFTDTLDPVIQKLKDFSDFLGITNFEENKVAEERQKRHNEQVKAQQKEIALLKQKRKIEKEDFDRNMAFLESQGKSTLRLRKARVLEQIEDEKAKEKLFKGLVFEKEAQRKIIELRTELNKINKAIRDENKNASKAKSEQDQKAIDDAEKLAQLERDRLSNLEKLRNELLDEIAEVEDENFERTQTEQENEERAVEEKYFRLIELAKQNGLDTNELEIGRLNELNDIKLKFGLEAQEQQDALDAEAAAKQKAIDDKKKSDAKALADYRFQVANQSLTAISDIAELFSKGNEKQAKRAFQVQKAVGIAQATINTAQAITKVFAETTDFTPTQTLRVANAVAIGVAGAAQVAAIASQQFQGGGGGGGGGTDVSVNSAPQAPSFNVVGDSGVNQLAQLQQQPTQAFVVSGEVTTAQALDRNRVQNATL